MASKYIQNPIPGHLYLDKDGIEIIYLGFGTYLRRSDTMGDLMNWGKLEPEHLYMKKADVDQKIAYGRLSADFKQYRGASPDGPDFWRTVFRSKKPRGLVADLGELYPADFFKNLRVEDHTLGAGCEYYWLIQTS